MSELDSGGQPAPGGGAWSRRLIRATRGLASPAVLDEEAENGGARLSEAEIDAIAERLRRGQYLDDHYRSALFRQAKEYELTYAAKQSRGQILAEEVVPLLVEL